MTAKGYKVIRKGHIWEYKGLWIVKRVQTLGRVAHREFFHICTKFELGRDSNGLSLGWSDCYGPADHHASTRGLHGTLASCGKHDLRGNISFYKSLMACMDEIDSCSIPEDSYYRRMLFFGPQDLQYIKKHPEEIPMLLMTLPGQPQLLKILEGPT